MAAFIYGETGFTNARPRYTAACPTVDPDARALEREGRAMYYQGKRMPVNPTKRAGYLAARSAHAASLHRIGGKADLS